MQSELTIQSGGVALAAESAGSGPLLVCLHAGVCDRRMWRPLVAQLAGEYRVVAYDRRGFGQTPALDEPCSDLQDLCAVLERCAPSGPVVLVGASRGGALAIDLALAQPERVAALVLLAPAVSGDPDSGYVPDDIQVLVDELEAAERAGDLARVNQLEVRIWLDGPSAPAGRAPAALRELVLDMNGIALASPPLTRRSEPEPAYPRLESLGTPALVLLGELDLPDRIALGQELATRAPRARAISLAGCAHLPSLEQPERVAREIRDFLARALGGG